MAVMEARARSQIEMVSINPGSYGTSGVDDLVDISAEGKTRQYARRHPSLRISNQGTVWWRRPV